MNKTQLKQVIEEEFQKLLKEYKYKLYHKSFTLTKKHESCGKERI